MFLGQICMHDLKNEITINSAKIKTNITFYSSNARYLVFSKVKNLFSMAIFIKMIQLLNQLTKQPKID